MTQQRKLGWLRSYADIRDYKISDVLPPMTRTIPGEHNLTQKYLSPIEDQGQLGSCTANAAAGMVEYMERAASGGTHIDISRIFLYKLSRKLANLVGDSGAYLRDTMKALRLFGCPPEVFYPYKISDFDREPSAYHYAMASNFKSLKYFRVDQPGMTPDTILAAIKVQSAKNYPLMFGFTCYESLYSPTADRGFIPFPSPGEQTIGGHAMTIVGYSDNRKAFRIRNSWGTGWGEAGYGWLPYQYVLSGLMDDIWGVTKQDWINLDIFN